MSNQDRIPTESNSGSTKSGWPTPAEFAGELGCPGVPDDDVSDTDKPSPASGKPWWVRIASVVLAVLLVVMLGVSWY